MIMDWYPGAASLSEAVPGRSLDVPSQLVRFGSDLYAMVNSIPNTGARSLADRKVYKINYLGEVSEIVNISTSYVYTEQSDISLGRFSETVGIAAWIENSGGYNRAMAQRYDFATGSLIGSPIQLYIGEDWRGPIRRITVFPGDAASYDNVPTSSRAQVGLEIYDGAARSVIIYGIDSAGAINWTRSAYYTNDLTVYGPDQIDRFYWSANSPNGFPPSILTEYTRFDGARDVLWRIVDVNTGVLWDWGYLDINANDVVSISSGASLFDGSKMRTFVAIEGIFGGQKGVQLRSFDGLATYGNIDTPFVQGPVITLLDSHIGSVRLAEVVANPVMGKNSNSIVLAYTSQGAIIINEYSADVASGALVLVDSRTINGSNIDAVRIGSFGDGRLLIDWRETSLGGVPALKYDIIDTREKALSFFGSGSVDDRVAGTRFDDSFYSGLGNDEIAGGAGNDTLVASDGIDTAVFSGARSDYMVAKSSLGLLVNDLRNGSPDGMDSLNSVERLRFQGSNTTLSSESFTPVNFNADTKSDLLWCNTSGLAAAFLMDGTNINAASAIGAANGVSWQVKAVGDLNGDGQSDLVWQHTSGLVVAWLMKGASIDVAAVIGDAGSAFRVVGSGDLNGDAKSDIVLQNSSGQAVGWMMDGASILSAATIGGANGSPWSIKAIGDLNGDGFDDLVWGDTAGSTVGFLMNGTSIKSASVVAGANGGSFAVKGAGDLNGDGKDDIVWQFSNGQAGTWFMNGTAISAIYSIGGSNGSQFEVKHIEDLNGDAKMDLVWENTTNGQAIGFLMNGATIVGAAAIGGANGPEWHIV